MSMNIYSMPEAAAFSNEEVAQNEKFDKIDAGYWSAFAAERSAFDASDEKGDRLDEAINEAFMAVAWTPAPRLRHVLSKVRILQHAATDVSGADWSNARAEIMIASIRRDLENLAR